MASSANRAGALNGRPLVFGALAVSQLPDVARALEEAVRSARAQLGGKPAFAIVAATADHFADRDTFEAALSATLGDLPHIGTSSHSLEANGAPHTQGALAVLMVGGAAAARSFAFASPRPEGEAPLPEFIDALEELGGPASSVIVFADPRGAQVAMIPRLVEKLAPCATLVGGGSTAAGPGPFQICDGRVASGIVVGLAVGVPLTPIGAFVSQGGELVGRRGVITKVDEGVLLEVDGEPATALLESLRQVSLPVTVEEVANLLSIAFAPGGPAALEQGQYVARNLRGVDDARSGLIVAARMVEGWGVSLLLREGIGARAQVGVNARRLAGALGPVPPAAGLYFDCMSRGEALYGASGVDEAQIRKALGVFPLLSLKSAFELGPLVIGERARPDLHLYSGVLWVLAGEGPPVPEGTC